MGDCRSSHDQHVTSSYALHLTCVLAGKRAVEVRGLLGSRPALKPDGWRQTGNGNFGRRTGSSVAGSRWDSLMPGVWGRGISVQQIEMAT
jgi:hypothetical protein